MTSLHHRPDRLIGYITALLATGCGVTSPDVLLVELRVDGEAVTATQPLEVVVSATNQSDRPMRVDSHGCPQVFEVTPIETTEPVGPESVACTLALLAPTELAPGEVLSFRYTWRGLGSGQDEEFLPSGVYRLRGWATPIEGDRVYSDYVQVEVRAP